MDDVKVSIAGWPQTLSISRFWELPSFWPFVPGKRVRRTFKVLPLYLDDPTFPPRRAAGDA